jgi:hypothetical protein
METLAVQVERPDSDWGNAPYSRRLARLQLLFSTGRVPEAIALANELSTSSEFAAPRPQFYLHLYKQELDEAAQAFEGLANAGDFYVIRGARGTYADRKALPIYQHPAYLEVLRKIGLDDQSVAALRIRPLPI